ncbi:MAG TPA: AcvB/VirJ family lysyl-phosphatidylglycerol hydrolase [Rhodanobacter sp.]|jgi:type IV secretory pathway VirJ component|nr:AcvB/VirJ family lysyl-phosphatidylglycerol hydrolase [Rhodanobacter sp.]
MKRRSWIMLAVVGTGLLGLALIWSPWSRVSLEKATVVLPVSSISTAPPAGKGDVMAIIYSGDGGWADLDRRLGIAFIDRGIPVLGVNTFKYYWRDRTPDESARELDALMTKYLGAWGKQRIWLVGYSFGADVLPTLVDKLSPENRARITQLVLLSPSRDVTFEIELEGYMIQQGWWKEHLKAVLQHVNPIRHYDALPPLQALGNQLPTVCYYGLDDSDDSVCTEPNLPGWVRVHPKKGDHHFDGGYQPLAAQMLQELPASTSTTAVTH